MPVKMKFIDKMNELVIPIIQSKGCELVDSEYIKEGSNQVLRFYIEKLDAKISIDDCAEVSEAISKEIDSDESIVQSFILEVSSPGVNRVLKKESDYIRFNGSKVDVSLYKPTTDNRKKFTAVLKGYNEGIFTFEIDGENITTAESEVSKLNLHFDF